MRTRRRGLLPLITTPGLGGMLALAVLAGLCFAPVTTTQIGVLDEVAPPERPAEAFAWLVTTARAKTLSEPRGRP